MSDIHENGKMTTSGIDELSQMPGLKEWHFIKSGRGSQPIRCSNNDDQSTTWQQIYNIWVWWQNPFSLAHMDLNSAHLVVDARPLPD